jgi:hypothetical protein
LIFEHSKSKIGAQTDNNEFWRIFMKPTLKILWILLALAGISGNALAQDPVSDIEKGCSVEIKQFCSQVSPGQGRMLACFYAHEDKLSGKCQFALYDAVAQLEHAVSALNYLASECEGDIMAHCADVQLGEGRVIDCLQSHGDTVSNSCRQAMTDVFE